MAQQGDRAWRRARAAQSREQRSTAIRTPDHAGVKPKRWYEVYWRRNKLKRAQQTGRIWPSVETTGRGVLPRLPPPAPKSG